VRRRFVRALICGAVVAWASCTSVVAEDYPSRPIRIVVPTSAGGTADLSARVFAQGLEARSKQAVVVDNRPGAGGIIGAEYASKATPDGYTLMIGGQQWMAILPSLKADLPYDPVKDFVPVAQLVRAPLILVVNPSVPVKSVADLVALAKAQPGKLTYGSAGTGSMGQLTAEAFKQRAGINLVGVSYKGVAPATQDVMAGHVSLTFDLVPNVTQHVHAGTLRALAVTVPQRVTALPDVPTMAEAGLPGVEAINWFALYAPAKTPPAIVTWLNREANAIFASPEVRQRLEAQNVILPGGPPEALSAYVAAERERWHRVIVQAGLKLE
jgi:tripartite-type tricarboxylate transporter receptor subunit TctC